MSEQLTLAQAAARLGLSPDTLRQQAHNGRFAATRLGPIWVTTDDEVERYRRENLGKVGPKPRRRRSKVTKWSEIKRQKGA